MTGKERKKLQQRVYEAQAGLRSIDCLLASSLLVVVVVCSSLSPLVLAQGGGEPDRTDQARTRREKPTHTLHDMTRSAFIPYP